MCIVKSLNVIICFGWGIAYFVMFLPLSWVSFIHYNYCRCYSQLDQCGYEYALNSITKAKTLAQQRLFRRQQQECKENDQHVTCSLPVADFRVGSCESDDTFESVLK